VPTPKPTPAREVVRGRVVGATTTGAGRRIGVLPVGADPKKVTPRVLEHDPAAHGPAAPGACVAVHLEAGRVVRVERLLAEPCHLCGAPLTPCDLECAACDGAFGDMTPDQVADALARSGDADAIAAQATDPAAQLRQLRNLFGI
jgi:hypothetical protein